LQEAPAGDVKRRTVWGGGVVYVHGGTELRQRQSKSATAQCGHEKGRRPFGAPAFVVWLGYFFEWL
jgi:hypothetical protein